MIDMAMGIEQHFRLQSVLLYEAHKLLLLLRVIKAGIDNYALTRLITKQIGVFLKRIEYEFMYVQHFINWLKSCS
jgi:hypothetical protein